MPVFEEASQPEILRAAQKDESFISQVRSELADIIQQLFGNRVWLKVQWLSDVACILAYYSLTTLHDNQTLGEEYVGLVQVDSTLRSLPSKAARLMAVSLQVLGPRLFAAVLKEIDLWVKNNADLKPGPRKYLSTITDLLQGSNHWIGRLNLILFYIYGRYYRLSQRVAGIHYVFTANRPESGSYRGTFGLIGRMALSHTVLLVVTNLLAKYKNSVASKLAPAEDAQKGETVPDSAKCSLCWERRVNSTATPCGHLFCWHCLLQWLQTKHECPLCRESVQPSRVVPLLNYK